MKPSTRSPKTPAPPYTTSLTRMLQRLEPHRAENVRAIREDLHDRDPTKAKTLTARRVKTRR